MQNVKIYYLISSISVIVGILFYSIYNDILIIRLLKKPKKFTHYLAQKKNFKLFFWKNNKWISEEKEIIESDNTIITLNYLLTSWLNLLADEHIITKKINIQTILLNSTGKIAYFSFDNNPIDKDQSTYQKLLLIESLLKTLRENNLNLQAIYLLVNNKPIADQHLDFQHEWPITGFLA